MHRGGGDNMVSARFADAHVSATDLGSRCDISGVHAGTCEKTTMNSRSRSIGGGTPGMESIASCDLRTPGGQ